MIIWFEDAVGELQEIEVDASITETHTLASAVTFRPVETGVAFTDHIRPEPRRVASVGMISNTPVRAPKGFTGEQRAITLDIPANPRAVRFGPTGIYGAQDQPYASSASVLQFSEQFDRVSTTWELFNLIHSTSQPITIVTDLQTYEDMAIESLSVTRDADRGNAIEFSFSAVELAFVSTSTVDAPEPARTPSQPRSQAPRDNGRQQGDEVDPNKRPSFLSKSTGYSQSSGTGTRWVPSD